MPPLPSRIPLRGAPAALLAWPLALGLLAACSSGGGSGSSNPPAVILPSVVFTTPTAGLLSPGSAVQIRIEVDGIADPERQVELLVDGLPAGIDLDLTGSALIGQLGLEVGSHVLRAEYAGSPGAEDQVVVFVPEPEETDGSVDENGELGGLVSAWSAPLLTVLGTTTTGDLGRSLAPLDDVDGDGTEDFAVGQSLSGLGGEVQFRSGQTGALLFKVVGTEGDRFGSALAEVSDVNGDGFSDLVVGATNAGDGDEGAAILLSGFDGSELWRTPGPDPEDGLGTSAAGLGDADGDLVPDVVIGARLSKKVGINGGRALVLSGADGSILHEVLGEMAFVQVGSDVGSAGDFDGDGRADFAVGSWGSWDNGPASGALTIYSGRDGLQLDRIPGPELNDHFGASVSLADDLTGDGRPDFVVGSPFARTGLDDGVELGEVRAYDGVTLEELWSRLGYARGGQFGREVQAVDDVDGDGAVDVLVGAPFELDGQGAVYLLSGADGTRLERRLGPPVIGFFGTACARLDDLDRDGRDEWAIGAPGLTSAFFLAGGAFVYTAGGLGVVDDGVAVSPLLATAATDDGDPALPGATAPDAAWALVAWAPGAGDSIDSPSLVLATGTGPEGVDLKLPGDVERELDGWTLRVLVASGAGLRASNRWRPGEADPR